MDMITIIDDWYITVEPKPINYVVRRGKGETDSKGKHKDKAIGYYGSLKNAVKGVRGFYIANKL